MKLCFASLVQFLLRPLDYQPMLSSLFSFSLYVLLLSGNEYLVSSIVLLVSVSTWLKLSMLISHISCIQTRPILITETH